MHIPTHRRTEQNHYASSHITLGGSIKRDGLQRFLEIVTTGNQQHDCQRRRENSTGQVANDTGRLNTLTTERL